MNGVIPLFKPKGMTSHDCVAKIRHLIGMKKVGHTGTLDPEVDGVLPICVGEATKIIPYLSPLKKVYEARVSLGTATTTEDATGDVIESKDVAEFPSDDMINDVLTSFTGEITQIPPMYSAVKLKGKKLYEYARENLPVERPERQIMIHDIERIDKKDEAPSKNTFSLRVHCSKGTYIRTLCVDIGKALGYPAHMASLQRVETDSVKVQETISFSHIEKAIENGRVNDIFLPITQLLAHIPTIQIDEPTKERVFYGQKLPIKENFEGSYAKMMYKDDLLAIYEKMLNNHDIIKPSRVFNLHKKQVK